MTGENDSQRRSFAARAREATIRCGTSATTVVGLLSLSGFLAGWAWPFELLCHFRVQYGVLFLSLAAVMAVLRRRRWAGMAVVLAVVNGWEVVPFYFASDPLPGLCSRGFPSITVWCGIAGLVLSPDPTSDPIISRCFWTSHSPRNET